MRILRAAVPAFLLAALAGCGGDDPPARATDRPGASPVDERSAHGDEVCPEELPLGEDPDGYGFGVQEPAEESPELLAPEEAWVCVYGLTGVGDGSKAGWRRQGEARPVPQDQLPGIAEALTELEPAPEEQMCTSDLGPRWLLVYAHQDDLTGVSVDGYGCRNVLLTDEPFDTPVGEAAQPGTVPGVLTGPEGLLIALQDADGELNRG